jgi:hypothetical protein
MHAPTKSTLAVEKRMHVGGSEGKGEIQRSRLSRGGCSTETIRLIPRQSSSVWKQEKGTIQDDVVTRCGILQWLRPEAETKARER